MSNFFFNSIKVLIGKFNQIIRLVVIGINVNLTACHIVQFAIDLISYTITNGNDHNNRRNTDNNSQHGKDGSSFVAFQVHDGNLNIFFQT